MAGIAVTGEAKEMRLSRGAIRYREVGEGPALVFVHGVLVNGTPWREVVPRLSGIFAASSRICRSAGTRYRWTRTQS